ncbi:MAG: hypothetical protein V4654_12370 [Bdellovibrionota bacterium]
MGQLALKNKTSKKSFEEKYLKHKEKMGDPKYAYNSIVNYIKDGDISNVTDVIASYISNSPNYSSVDDFAKAIGTSRRTLFRMLSNSDGTSLKVFFSAMERVYGDSIS